MGFVALGNAAWDDPWCTPTLVEGVKGISRTGSRSSSIGDMACRLQVSLKGADCGGRNIWRRQRTRYSRPKLTGTEI